MKPHFGLWLWWVYEGDFVDVVYIISDGYAVMKEWHLLYGMVDMIIRC